jgi:hypothetical protein
MPMAAGTGNMVSLSIDYTSYSTLTIEGARGAAGSPLPCSVPVLASRRPV